MPNMQWQKFCRQGKFHCRHLGFSNDMASMQLLGRSHKCTVRKSGGFQVSLFSFLHKTSFPYYRAVTCPQHSILRSQSSAGTDQGNFLCFLSFLRHYPSSQGRRPWIDFVHFPVGRWASRGQNPSSAFLLLLVLQPWEEICQHKDKLQGRRVQVTLFLLSLLLFSSWGTGRGHNHLSVRDFFHINAHFQYPNSEKSHYTGQYLEHMLKCCPEHRWTSTHV